MISAWTIYWITTLDSINVVCAFSVCLFLFLPLFHLLPYFFMLDAYNDKEIDKIKANYLLSLKRVCIPGFIISTLLCVFIPTTNSMALIYIVPKIANSDFMKQVPPKLEKLAMKKIDELLSENSK